MERNNNNTNNQRSNRGGNNANRGRGAGRGRGRGNVYLGHVNQNNNNAPHPRQNNNRGPHPPQPGVQRNGTANGRNENYQERPWTMLELQAWLKKTIALDPDQTLSNLTNRDENKFKNALNETMLCQEVKIVELMVQLLASPDLMDHIRSTTSGSFYSMVMASKFLQNLATFMMLDGASLSKGCLKSMVKLLGHLLDLSNESLFDMVSLIQHLAIRANTLEESLALEITRLVAKRDHMLEQRKKRAAQAKDDGGPRGNFRDVSLFPSKEEMFNSPNAPHLRKNKVEGEHYADLDDYLDMHFRLLHEDGFADIRKAVFHLHRGDINKRLNGVKVYQNVPVAGTRLNEKGVFFQMNIGAHTKINWARSKRLMTGALLCLSSDDFASDLLWAVVGNRDEKMLAKGKIEIELVTGYDPKFNAGKLYTIVEASTAYFEAFGPVLRALQAKGDNVPFQDYLLKYSKVIAAPKYLQERDFWDMTAAFRGTLTRHVNILKPWPSTQTFGEGVDDSQLAALKQVLTKELAIVQGPPGTGKTYIGLQAAKLMLANNAPVPILCVCYTNHALDQFLEGIYQFEKKILRLGGRSKSEIMQNECSIYSRQWQMSGTFYKERKDLLAQIERMKVAILEIARKISAEYVSVELLATVFSPTQMQSLKSGLSKKFNDNQLVQVWLTDDKKAKTKTNAKVQVNNNNRTNGNPRANNAIQNRPIEDDLEDSDEEFADEIDENELLELLAEREDYREPVPPGQADAVFNVRVEDADELDEEELNGIMQTIAHVNDPWTLDMTVRRNIHDRILKINRTILNQKLTEWSQEYYLKCRELKDLNNTRTMAQLREAKVIGMTTTAAAKNVDLLRALKPKIVIVEEAAEVLEAHIITALTKDTQHLILIGDHQQLRPSTAVYALSKKYNLDVSLFERMTKNEVPYKRLSTQRRMRPEISKLISPLYKHLNDHPSVAKHPQRVLGVEKNLFFLDHKVLESTSAESTSKFNEHEVMLVANLCLYLVQQGYKPEKITVLTMYLQQLFRVKEQLKENSKYNVACGLIRVSSVDNYQGEENDIIILSLVRSNKDNNIGFLKIANRVCVALSRARNAFYIVGNATLMQQQSELWQDIIYMMMVQNNVGPALKLCCQNHPENYTMVSTGLDIREKARDGGCTLPCQYRLECGHSCKKFCHPGGHDEYVCYELCRRKHPCGHYCGKMCHEECGECTQLVTVKLEACGHDMTVPCNASKLPITCTNRCPRQLPCSHQCMSICSRRCPDKCNTMVDVRLPCNHVQRVACHLKHDPYAIECDRPCAATLDCGHKCAGTCGKCKNGHVKCTEPCKRTLVCNHTCSNTCEKSCAPCKKKCQIRCVHSKCHAKCSDVCPPCLELCSWKCPHHKCDKLCSEVCTRSRCNKPCRKMLKCRHPCMGLCGEKCPDLCRVCGNEEWRDEITQNTLAEGGDDARYIQLDCSHIFDVDGLDQYVGVQMSENNISFLKCPTCRAPIQMTGRYFPEIRRRMADIDAVKARVLATTIANEGVVKYQNREFAEAKKLFQRALKLDPTNTEVLLKLARTELALQQFNEANVTLTKLLAIDPINKEAKEMLENCNEEKFKKEIVKAMSSEIKKGGWYKCPNGHLYTIGECGGAMQQSTCPECGATIGGVSHSLSQGNQRSNIDGGEG